MYSNRADRNNANLLHAVLGPGGPRVTGGCDSRVRDARLERAFQLAATRLFGPTSRVYLVGTSRVSCATAWIKKTLNRYHGSATANRNRHRRSVCVCPAHSRAQHVGYFVCLGGGVLLRTRRDLTRGGENSCLAERDAMCNNNMCCCVPGIRARCSSYIAVWYVHLQVVTSPKTSLYDELVFFRLSANWTLATRRGYLWNAR